MQTVIIVVHLMIVSALIGVVLLQRSEGGGLGIGSSGGGGFLSSRGTANVLTRTTAFLAAGFFVTSLFLSWLAGLERKPSSLIGAPSAPASRQAPASEGESGKSLLDQLKSQEAPSAPSGPQVPRSQ